MKKGRGWIVAGVLLIGGVAASPLLMGQGIESAVKGGVDKTLTGQTSLLAENGLDSYVKVKENTYTRGTMDSTQMIKVDFGCPGQPTTTLEMRNKIQHGPFPGFSGLGLARVDTEVVLPTEVQTQLNKALGGKKWTIQTLVNFDGSSTSTLTLPAGNMTQEGTRMEWQAGTGQIRSSGAGKNAVYNINFPQMTVTATGGEGVTLENVRLEGNTQQVAEYKNLSQGKQSFSMGRMSFKAEGQAVALENISVNTDTRIQGDNSGFDFALEAGKLSVGKQTLSNITLKMGMEKLKASSLQQLTEASRSLSSNVCDPASADPTMLGLKLISPMLELIQSGPKLRIDRLAFKVPEGETVLSGSAEFADASKLNVTNLNSAALEQLRANLKFNSSQKALSTVVAGFGGTAVSVEEGITNLQTLGYIKKTGDALSSDLKFENKRLMVNGQEIPLGL